MGSCSSGGKGGGLGGGGEGLNPGDILGTSNLLIDTDLDEATRGEVSRALKDFQDEYGLAYNNTRIANITPNSGVMAYYDGDGIAINSEYLDSKTMNEAYKRCVESGFHPSSGSKSGLEAVVSHELGHALNDMIGAKMGTDIDGSAKKIFNEAMNGSKRTNAQNFAGKISGYAKYSYAEAVAEAISDCYCNGKKAKSESKAIKKVVDKYLKNERNGQLTLA